MGGDFTYQDAAMWYQNLDKLIKYTNLKAAKDGLDMKLFYSTPDCYLKAVKDSNPTLPTKQDDFFPYASDPTAYWTGYFTSRPTTKLFEREGNGYLQMVKNLQVLSDLEKHNMFVINELQSAVGVMQHHDAITGTEKEHVTHDYERLLDAAVEDASIVAKQAFNKIIGGNAAEPPTFEYVRCRLNESSCHITETSDKFVVTVYNPVGWQTEEPIRLPVGSGAYRVITPGGLEIDSQIIELSDAVKNIPSRKSSASRELVFIAHLHPLGVKSFYVEKVGKSKRHAQNNRDYYNINSYWKDIKIQPKVDDTKNAEHNYKIPLPVEKVKYAERVDMDIDDLAMLKGDGFKGVDLESVFGDRSQVRSGGRNLDKQKYSNLNEEEMRMLSDEPLIVDRYKEFYVENQNLKLRIDNATSQITHAFTDDITTNMQIAFFYWTGCVGNNSIYSERSSGAYIFRPKTTTPIPITSKITKVFKGPVVQELRVESTENVGSTIRMYTGVPYIEHEFVVGPIDITDNVGKEYIVRYNTNIFNNGIFYTDSNGRQMLKRKLNERPQWNLTLEEPIAGNYYPVTTNMFIEDENIRASVLTDRSEGGTSLEEGSLEIMLHRRLLHDDAFGVGEALNETANGKGLVMRGKHRVMLYKPTEDSILMERKQILQMHLTPIVFAADAKNVDLAQWLTLNNCFKPLQQELPNGVHLLTLEPWDDKHILIRFENYKDKSPNSTIEIDLASIFDVMKVISIRETTLAANQWYDEYNKWNWTKEGKFSNRFNDDYNNFGPKVTAADEDEVVSDYGFKIKLKAKQIRTFIAEYEILKF